MNQQQKTFNKFNINSYRRQCMKEMKLETERQNMNNMIAEDNPYSEILKQSQKVDKLLNALCKCPFCGGEAEIITNKIEYEDVYSIECTECPATMTSIYKDKLIGWWNTRVYE